jgi:hypothetical protein
MFRRLFDTSEIDSLATFVVEGLRRELPPERLGRRNGKADERLAAHELQVARRLSALAEAGGLNLYKKAKLGGIVKEALVGAGYPQDFVERYVGDLVALAATAGLRKR